MNDRKIYSGLIRLLVLYHESHQPLFGLEMIRELRRHGHELSPGTLYPLIHGMEKGGYLVSAKKLANGRFRRLYRVTPLGRRTLKEARTKVRALFGEPFEGKRDRNCIET